MPPRRLANLPTLGRKAGRTYVNASNKSWGGARVLAGGVSCYSSTNLYDWKNEGLVLPPVPNHPGHDLHREEVIERPKVIYIARTKKFVMWFHLDTASYSAARSGVAVSESPTGRFRYLGSFRPNAGVWPVNVTPQLKKPGEVNLLARDFENGQMARDQTSFVDNDPPPIKSTRPKVMPPCTSRGSRTIN